MAKKTKKKTIVKKSGNKTIIIVDNKDKKKKDYEVGKGKPPKQHQFKKGKVANPTGVNCNPIKRAINEFNSMELSKAIKLVMTSTEEEALAAVNDPSTTLGFKTVLRAMIDASHDGNYSKFYEIAEHVIGKIPNKVELNGGVSLGAKLDDKEKLKEVLKLVENEF